MSDAAQTWTVRNFEDGSVRHGLSRDEAAAELRRLMGIWTAPELEPEAAERAEREVELVA